MNNNSNIIIIINHKETAAGNIQSESTTKLKLKLTQSKNFFTLKHENRNIHSHNSSGAVWFA